jgi:SWI/SNF-related matrix-associated actin-dependent regulator of chromatin subfamily A member 5
MEQPASIRGGQMKDYQLDGLSFLAHLVDNGMGGNNNSSFLILALIVCILKGILGDEMGLGKTLQTLSLLSYIKDSSGAGPFLIICPLSVLSSWEKVNLFNRIHIYFVHIRVGN